MKRIEGIAGLAERYDGFILDLWGVVHDGRAPYPGVADALARLAAAGKPVVFLSNAPRRAWFVEKQLAGMGIGRALYTAIVTSGELAHRGLRDRTHPFFATLGDRALHIGPERDLSVLEGLPVTRVARAAEASFLLNTGPDVDRGPDRVEPYLPALREAAAHALPMLCCNPDREVMVGPDKLIAAGALADAYIAMGGEVHEVGKPDAAVYAPTIAEMRLPAGARICAIGDSPRTDLLGAQRAGLDAVWALTGLAAEAHGEAPDDAALAAEAARFGVAPIAWLPALRW
jgi:HAD superfamily hydrolase (TIGR01459 family)